MEELITFIAQNLVDHPEDVKTVVKGTENDVTIELSVHPDDMGKIIGKQGRMAKALRTIVKAAAVGGRKADPLQCRRSSNDDYVRIGLILKPKGIKGELKVQPLTDDPERYRGLTEGYLEHQWDHGSREGFGKPH